VVAYSGLFMGFGSPIPGREQQAIGVFNELVEHMTGLQQRGEIDAWEPVFLEPHGGDLGGFFLLRGDPDRLARIRTSDDFYRLSTRAQLVVDGFGVVGADVGDRIGAGLGVFQEQVGELT
jgi:hypothetical protein